MATSVAVGNLGSFDLRELSNVTKIDFSWTMDEGSQCTVQCVDENFQMLSGNYFQVRNDLLVGNDVFNIATLRVEQSETKSPLVTIEGRRLAIQQMKRDKNPGAISAASGTEYASIAAARFNMKFQGQATSEVPNITAVNQGSADESVWSVLQSLAGQAQFVIFESDNTLYFASEQWLLGRYGIPGLAAAGISLFWPGAPQGWDDAFPLQEIPECYTSDDDPYAAEFRAVVERTNATQIRPGMTAFINGIPNFKGTYLVTEVAYQLDVPDPVSVSGRTPQKPRDKDGKVQPEYRQALG